MSVFYLYSSQFPLPSRINLLKWWKQQEEIDWLVIYGRGLYVVDSYHNIYTR